MAGGLSPSHGRVGRCHPLAYADRVTVSAGLEVICGPMFSGKTDELIDRFEAAAGSGRRAVALKAAQDTRHPADSIVSHSARRIPAIAVASAAEVSRIVPSHALVLLDETQFFDESLPSAIAGLRVAGSDVIAAGLDYDFRGEAFATTSELIADASIVTRLTAICSRCRSAATLTQRLARGRPAPLDEPQIVVGDRESYEPRCERCWLEERAAH
jgi:thymidine kinase